MNQNKNECAPRDTRAPCSLWQCPDCKGSLECYDELVHPDGKTVLKFMLCFECSYECVDRFENNELVSTEVMHSKKNPSQVRSNGTTNGF